MIKKLIFLLSFALPTLAHAEDIHMTATLRGQATIIDQSVNPEPIPGWALDGDVRFSRIFSAGMNLTHGLREPSGNWVTLSFHMSAHLLSDESKLDLYLRAIAGDSFFGSEQALLAGGGVGMRYFLTEHLNLNLEVLALRAIPFNDPTATDPTLHPRMTAVPISAGIGWRF